MNKPELQNPHNDKRGSIFLIKDFLKEGKEINFSITKKGFARGGCIHRQNDEYLQVLEGEIDLTIGKSEYTTVLPGEWFRIARESPHFYIAKEDSIVMEWGATEEEKKEKDPTTRSIVDDINKSMEN